MSACPAVELVRVGKRYPIGWLRRRHIQAVQDVSLRIQSGEVFGLLGPNRAGKTTVVKMILSLATPTVGQIRRFGRPAGDRHTLARVGYMHENQAFPRYWNATGLLAYYGAMTFLPESDVRETVRRLLQQVRLSDRCTEPIGNFSKGMVQRLALAQALLNDPELLILDEPTEGLDMEGRQLLRGIVEERRAQGKSVLLVSHVLSEVERLCDRVGVLVNGRLVHAGPLAELVRKKDAAPPQPLEQALQDLYEVSA